jgi:hypothetical protein
LFLLCVLIVFRNLVDIFVIDHHLVIVIMGARWVGMVAGRYSGLGVGEIDVLEVSVSRSSPYKFQYYHLPEPYRLSIGLYGTEFEYTGHSERFSHNAGQAHRSVHQRWHQAETSTESA